MLIRTSHRFLVAAFAAIAICATASAQIAITKVTPNVASPGDTILLEGTNLHVTSMVVFRANVGGFVGFLNVPVAPQSVTPTLVTVVVPMINAFAPPGVPGGGSPLGFVKCDDASGRGGSNFADLFYCEGMFGAVDTFTTGTTQSTGQKPYIEFDVRNGPPVPGNLGFTVELTNAIPNVQATLIGGVPANPPSIMLGDGFLALDPSFGGYIFPIRFTDGNGETDRQISIPGPGPWNANFILQWIVYDPGSPNVYAFSNALNITI